MASDVGPRRKCCEALLISSLGAYWKTAADELPIRLLNTGELGAE